MLPIIKRHKLTVIVLLVFCCSAYKIALPPPQQMWANTGAPGEQTCANCHNSYDVNSGGGYLHLWANPPINNGTYTAGQTYTITASFSQPPLMSYQCSIEIVDSLGNNAGTMAIVDSYATTLQTSNIGRLAIWGGLFGTDTIFNCTFQWTAPLTGQVSMYAAGVVHGPLVGGTDGWVYLDSLVGLHTGLANSIESFKSKRLSVYPNPATSYIFIDAYADLHSCGYVILTSAGQIIKTGNLYNKGIDISGLKTGSYLLQLNKGQQKLTGAFVKY